MKKNARWYFWLGVGLVIAGTLALMFSFFSTIFSIIYLASFLIVAGIFEIVKAVKVSEWRNRFLHFFIGALYIIAGGLLIHNPIGQALSLTLLLALFFIGAGIVRIGFALFKDVPHRGWLALNGVLTLLLGGMILYQWPMSGLWVIGMLVGIEMIFTGWTWIILSSRVKQLEN